MGVSLPLPLSFSEIVLSVRPGNITTPVAQIGEQFTKIIGILLIGDTENTLPHRQTSHIQPRVHGLTFSESSWVTANTSDPCRTFYRAHRSALDVNRTVMSKTWIALCFCVWMRFFSVKFRRYVRIFKVHGKTLEMIVETGPHFQYNGNFVTGVRGFYSWLASYKGCRPSSTPTRSAVTSNQRLSASYDGHWEWISAPPKCTHDLSKYNMLECGRAWANTCLPTFFLSFPDTLVNPFTAAKLQVYKCRLSQTRTNIRPYRFSPSLDGRSRVLCGYLLRFTAYRGPGR